MAEVGVEHVRDVGGQVARRQVLSGPQALVRRAPLDSSSSETSPLKVGARCGAGLLVDEVDDQALELGHVLNPILRLVEDCPQRSRLVSEADEDLGIDDRTGWPISTGPWEPVQYGLQTCALSPLDWTTLAGQGSSA